MKKILLMLGVAFLFSACNKCVECTFEYTDGTTEQWDTYYDNEEFGDRIFEVCSDNFESKDDFNNYIDAIEKYEDADCKSDFWN